jgi:hypothetical protein
MQGYLFLIYSLRSSAVEFAISGATATFIPPETQKKGTFSYLKKSTNLFPNLPLSVYSSKLPIP